MKRLERRGRRKAGLEFEGVGKRTPGMHAATLALARNILAHPAAIARKTRLLLLPTEPDKGSSLLIAIDWLRARIPPMQPNGKILQCCQHVEKGGNGAPIEQFGKER